MDAFPTLAERLALGERTGGERPPLALWIEAGAGGDAGAALAQARDAAPGSFVAVVGAADGESHSLRRLGDLRALLDEAPGADVVLVDPRRDVSGAILDELASAAESDSVCASVSYVDAASSPHARGEIPPPALDGPAWGLVYIRRDALALGLALEGDGAPVNGSVRELLGGLLSGAGFVHRGLRAAPPQASRAPSPAGRSNASSIHVAIDVRHLDAPVTGAQVQSLSLLEALARTGDLELTALAPLRLHPTVERLVQPLRDRVEFTADLPTGGADVFHLPHQVGSLHELVECLRYGRRFVLTHLDMIAYRTPAYFASEQSLATFRRTTSAALASADQVGFFSEHAALDAASDGIVDPDRATVVPLGVDHIRPDGPAERPAALASLGGPFVLVLGTAFEHKNRLFALRVLRELVERRWEGSLVLVGRDAPRGSSLPAERRLLEQDARLRERVVVLGHVSEAQKRGLYRDAGVVLFPSLYEGFGLIPFEAAAFGTPCLYAWRGALREFLPAAGALPADFSVAETASGILELLESTAAREALVSEIRGSAATLTWDRTARGYMEVYRRALQVPPRPLDRAVFEGVGLDGIPLSAMERAVVDVYRRRPAFRTLVDSLVRVGAVTTRVARRARRS